LHLPGEKEDTTGVNATVGQLGGSAAMPAIIGLVRRRLRQILGGESQNSIFGYSTYLFQR
jgi:hypothetical protein